MADLPEPDAALDIAPIALSSQHSPIDVFCKAVACIAVADLGVRAVNSLGFSLTTPSDLVGRVSWSRLAKAAPRTTLNLTITAGVALLALRWATQRPSREERSSK